MSDARRQVASVSHSPGIVLAAVASWVAPAAVLFDRLTSTDLPAKVPTHWNGSLTIDAWYPVQAAFWMSFFPGLVGAVLITVIVVFAGDDISRFAGSAGLAAGAFVTGGIALTWFSSLAAARSPAHSPEALLGLLFWTTLLALLVFSCGVLPRKAGSSGPAQHDD